MIFAAVWRRYLPPPPALVGWAVTIAYFMLTGVFFRAPSLTVAWHIFEGLATLPDVQIAGRNAFVLAAFCAIALPPSHEIISRITKRPHPAIAYGLAGRCDILSAGNRPG